MATSTRVEVPARPADRPTRPSEPPCAADLLDDALAAATVTERRRQRRLGRIVDDPAARELVQRLTDEVLRIARPRAAARPLRPARRRARRARGARSDRPRPAGAPAPAAAHAVPRLVMPLVRRRIVAETRGLVIPASDPGARPAHRARRRGAGVRPEHQPARRGDPQRRRGRRSASQRVLALVARPDVDYVSVKISALCAQLDVVAFDAQRRAHRVDRAPGVRRRGRPRAGGVRQPRHGGVRRRRTSPSRRSVRVLDEPPFRTTPAGIVVQAYLPDAHAVLERLGDVGGAARGRRGSADQGAHRQGRQPGDGAGRGRAARLGAGDVPDQGRHRRQLQAPARLGPAAGVGRRRARRRRQPQPVRRGLGAGVPGRSRRTARELEIEMLEGMVPAQARAVQAAAGGLLLYCPIVRSDELDASLAYLARRFDENTAPENFLRAMFDMTPGSRGVAPSRRRGSAPRSPPRLDVSTVAAPAGRGRRRGRDSPTGRSPTNPTPISPTAAARAPRSGTRDRRAAGRRRAFPIVDDRRRRSTPPSRRAVAAGDRRGRRGPVERARPRCCAPSPSDARRDRVEAIARDGRRGRQDRRARPTPRSARPSTSPATPRSAELSPGDRAAVAWSSSPRRGTSRTRSPPAGCFAALMAGNAVMLKPAPRDARARRGCWPSSAGGRACPATCCSTSPAPTTRSGGG